MPVSLAVAGRRATHNKVALSLLENGLDDALGRHPFEYRTHTHPNLALNEWKDMR